jgi:hypothetical protein
MDDFDSSWDVSALGDLENKVDRVAFMPARKALMCEARCMGCGHTCCIGTDWPDVVAVLQGQPRAGCGIDEDERTHQMTFWTSVQCTCGHLVTASESPAKVRSLASAHERKR